MREIHGGAVARAQAAEEAEARVLAGRRSRLAARDRAYRRILALNPEGNNRNKGSAPVGRISRKGNRARQNHSGAHTNRPTY